MVNVACLLRLCFRLLLREGTPICAPNQHHSAERPLAENGFLLKQPRGRVQAVLRKISHILGLVAQPLHETVVELACTPAPQLFLQGDVNAAATLATRRHVRHHLGHVAGGLSGVAVVIVAGSR